jgi:hypothetical protein
MSPQSDRSGTVAEREIIGAASGYSLGRLLAKQGQRQEARVMLTDIYGWFTEGFDTADLMDAKTLLDELNA